MTIRVVIVVVSLLMAMGLTTWRSWRGDFISLIVALCLSVAWLGVNKGFEGPVLLELTTNHGIVLTDVVAIVVAGASVIGWLRSRMRQPADNPVTPAT